MNVQNVGGVECSVYNYKMLEVWRAVNVYNYKGLKLQGAVNVQNVGSVESSECL